MNEAAGGEAHAEVVEPAVVAQAQLHVQGELPVHHAHHEEAVHTLDGPDPVQSL